MVVCLCVLNPVIAQPAGLLAGPIPFVVEGWVTNDFSSPPLDQKQQFQLRSDGLKWWMALSGPFGPTQHFEVFYDGTNTYYLNNMKAFLEEKRANGEKMGDNVATAMVRKGAVPYFDLVDKAGLVWLTFLSGSTFTGKPSGTGFITPPCFLGILASGLLYGEDFTLHRYVCSPDSGNDLCVPKHIDYLFEATNLPAPPRNIAIIEAVKRFAGMTNVTFDVLEESQIGRHLVPRSSRLVVYVPAQLGRSARQITYGLTATNISVGAKVTNLVAEIPGLTHFTDLRFASASRPLVRFSYDGFKWLSDSEAASLPQYRAVLRMWPAPGSSRGTALLLSVLILLMLFPAYLARVSRKQKRAKQSEQ